MLVVHADCFTVNVTAVFIIEFRYHKSCSLSEFTLSIAMCSLPQRTLGIALYFIELLSMITLHFIAIYCIVFYGTVRISMHCILLHSSLYIWPCITLLNIALHYAALYFMSLSCVHLVLHCILPHRALTIA